MGGVTSRHAEGGLDQATWQATAQELMSQSGIQQRVELRLAAHGLPKKDKLSESDPMAVVFQASASGQTIWREAGRTDVVANSTDPQWVRPILCGYNATAPQPIKIAVYDVDKVCKTAKQSKALNLASQDYIGEVEVMLSDVMAAPGCQLELQLTDVEGGRMLPSTCTLVLKGEPMAPNDNRVVRMAFGAAGVPKRDVMSQSDPFLMVLKLRADGGAAGEDWVPVFKTEVRMNNPDPVWQPIEVDIRQLCSADDQRPLKLQVWDYQSSGKHQLIGECRTTLAQLQTMGAGPNLAVHPAAGAAAGAPTVVAAAVATAVGAPATPTTPAPAAAATPVPVATTAAAPAGAATEAAPGAATNGAAATTATAPAAPTGAAAAVPAAVAAPPSSRSFELTLPATAKNIAVGKCGTLLVRQVQVRPGVTPRDLMAGCLQGCLG